MFWRVNRESVLLVAGATALLLQVAHPKIAAGVTDHSDFRERPLRRLYRTIKVMQGVIYGNRESALATTAGVLQIHTHINGQLKESTSLFETGAAYSAEDPDLVLWVYATLIDTMMRAYSTFVQPLSPAEAQSFYRESRTIAILFGAPDELVPSTLDEFREYFNEIVAGPTLEITPTARAVAADIIHPPIRGVPNVLGDLVSIPALALLPEELRTRYGFKWDRKRKIAWRLARRVIRRGLPLVPKFARVNGGARRAERLLR